MHLMISILRVRLHVVNVGTNIEARALDWSDPSTYPNDTLWDVVIGADIVWVDYLIPSLVNALNHCCQRETDLFLAYQVLDSYQHGMDCMS